MLVAIISDTHSRYHTVEKVLKLLRDGGAEMALHCGDIEDAETVRLFHGLATHFVFGNCDTKTAALRRAIQESGATLHEHFGDLELAGRKIAFIHGHEHRLFRDLEQSGRYDFLFYGHSHRAEEHRTGLTRVINPGALHRARVKTFVTLDLASGEVESVTLE